MLKQLLLALALTALPSLAAAQTFTGDTTVILGQQRSTGLIGYRVGVNTFQPIGTSAPGTQAWRPLLQPPTTSILGGILAKAAVANQFIVSVNLDGSITSAQPIFANLGGVLLASQVPAFQGGFTCSGLTCTLSTPTGTSLGGVFSKTSAANQFQTGIDLTGTPLFAQPTFPNIGGTIASSQVPTGLVLPSPSLAGTPNTPNFTGYLYANGGSGWTASTTIPSAVLTGTINGNLLPAPTATTFGGIVAASAGANQFQTGVSTSGVPIFAQPSFGNLSGSLACTQTPAESGDISSPAGSCVYTLATVNTTPGTYGGASSVPIVTVNGKGLATTVTTIAVVAPAGTLSGTALASNVTGSSLTGLGTIATGVWQGTPIAAGYIAAGAAASNVGTLGGALAGTLPNPSLATVNSNTGSFGGASGIPVFTVTGGGQITSASTVAVVAPAGTLSGTTLNSTVTNSSLATFAAGAAYNNLAANSVDSTKMSQASATTLRGNPTGGTANVVDAALTTHMDAAFGATQGQIVCRSSSGWSPISAAGAASGYVLTYSGANACPSPQSPAAASAAPRSSVRQTVQGGPQASGAPSFLPATSSNLNLAAQNVSTGANALTVAAAQGSNVSGQNDLIVQFTSNPTWSGLVGSQTISGSNCSTSACTETTSAAHNLVVGATVTLSGCSSAFLNGTFQVASVPSSTTYTVNGPNPQSGTAFASATPTGCSYTVQNYLAINASSGATVSSLLQPIYQYGGTIPTTANQFAFDRQAMIGYVGGTATPLVYVGQATASASTITSTIAYAYNGTYQSTVQAFPTSSTPLVATHNIGIAPGVWSIGVVFTTAYGGYSVGDQISYNDLEYSSSPTNRQLFGATSAYAMQLIVELQALNIPTKSGGNAFTAAIPANNGVIFTASRGW